MSLPKLLARRDALRKSIVKAIIAQVKENGKMVDAVACHKPNHQLDIARESVQVAYKGGDEPTTATVDLAVVNEGSLTLFGDVGLAGSIDLDENGISVDDLLSIYEATLRVAK